MPIEIQDPANVPGGPVQGPITSLGDPFANTPSLRAIGGARAAEPGLSFDALHATLAPDRPGTILGGPSPNHIINQWADRGYGTPAPIQGVDPALLRGGGAPIFPSIPGKVDRTGSITWNTIDPVDTVRQLMSGATGVAPTPTRFGEAGAAGGIDPAMFLAQREIDLTNFPTRLMDYASNVTWVPALRALGVMTETKDYNGMLLTAWHNDPNYWGALQYLTEDQVTGYAHAIADQYQKGYQNAGLADALDKQFKLDRLKALGLSSGDEGTDYVAFTQYGNLVELGKKYGVEPRQALADLRGLEADFAAPAPGWLGVPMPLTPKDLLRGPKPSDYQNELNILRSNAGAGWGGVPLVGDIYRMNAAISPEVKKLWLELTPDERSYLIQNAGRVTGITSSLAMFGAFSAAGAALAMARGAAAGGNAIAKVLVGAPALANAPTATTIVGRVGATLSGLGVYGAGQAVVLKAMQFGTTVAITNWALEAAIPDQWGSIGHAIDDSRPISNSAAAGVLNTLGYFHGFGEIFAPERYLLSKAVGSVPGMGGGPVHPLEFEVLGGMPGRNLASKLYSKLPPNLLDTSMKRLVFSETQGAIKDEAVRYWTEAIRNPTMEGVPEGWAEQSIETQIRHANLQLGKMEASLPVTMEEMLRLGVAARRQPGPFANADTFEARRIISERVRTYETAASERLLRTTQDDWSRRLGFDADGNPAPVTTEGKLRFLVQQARRLDWGLNVELLQKQEAHVIDALANRMYHAEFDVQNGRLQASIEQSKAANPESRADHIGIVRQDHIFKNNMRQLQELREAGDSEGLRDMAWRLAQGTREGQAYAANDAYAFGERGSEKTRDNFNVTRFVRHVESLEPGLMERRTLPEAGETLDRSLNTLQAQLDADGLWTLSYKPEMPPEYRARTPEDAAAGAPTFASFTHVGGPGAEGVYLVSPWTEYMLETANAVEIGNQGFMAAKADSVFRAWRTYRINEFARAMVFRRISPLEGTTGAQMDRFHNELTKMARENRFPDTQMGVNVDPQALSVMAAREIQRIGEEIFGRQERLNRVTGRMENPDWAEITRQAYRQSIRMNASAGLTSRLYSSTVAPGVSKGLMFVGKVLNPLARFTFGIRFHLSELLEGPVMNGVNGVFGRDVVARSTYAFGGVRRRFGSAAHEAIGDPSMGNMGATNRQGPPASDLGFANVGKGPRPAPADSGPTSAGDRRWARPDEPLDTPGGQHAPPGPENEPPPNNNYRPPPPPGGDRYRPGRFTAADTRTLRQKLEDMARDTSSPFEAAAAQRVLDRMDARAREAAAAGTPTPEQPIAGKGFVASEPGVPEDVAAAARADQAARAERISQGIYEDSGIGAGAPSAATPHAPIPTDRPRPTVGDANRLLDQLEKAGKAGQVGQWRGAQYGGGRPDMDHLATFPSDAFGPPGSVVGPEMYLMHEVGSTLNRLREPGGRFASKRPLTDEAVQAYWDLKQHLQGPPVKPEPVVAPEFAAETPRKPDMGRLSQKYKAQWIAAGVKGKVLNAVTLLIEARARTMGIHPDELHASVRVVGSGDSIPTDALYQSSLKLDKIAAATTRVRVEPLLMEPPPKELVDAGLAEAAPLEWHTLPGGREIAIPGGTKGTWSLWDLWRLKSQQFDPGALPPKLRSSVYHKLFRTQKRALTNPVDVFNRVTLGVLSPGLKLLKNEAGVAALRVSGLRDVDVQPGQLSIESIARMTPDEVMQVMRRTGVGSKAIGGQVTMMVRNAKRFMANPDWYAIRKGEGLLEYSERMLSSLDGAGMKVANFSVMLGDPFKFPRGTIDSHMVELLYREGYITAEQADLVRKASGKLMNPAVSKLSPKGPNTPDYLRNIPKEVARSDGKVMTFGSTYKIMVDALEKMIQAEHPGLPFKQAGAQWMLWDMKRGIFEPHTTVFPGSYKLPGMTPEAIRQRSDVAYTAGYGAASPRQRIPYSPSEGIFWQGEAGGVGPRGWTLKTATETIIGLTKTHDASTAVHELWHGVLEPSATAAQRAVLERHGASGENGARLFEHYLATGRAPTSTLRRVFANLKALLTRIYEGMKESPLNLELHPNVKGVFDEMLGGKKSTDSVTLDIDPPPLGSEPYTGGTARNLRARRAAAPKLNSPEDWTAAYDWGETGNADAIRKTLLETSPLGSADDPLVNWHQKSTEARRAIYKSLDAGERARLRDLEMRGGAVEPVAPVPKIKWDREHSSAPAEPTVVSEGHIGWTWTIEGGLAEVFKVGDTIVRAPASASLHNGKSRSGREWWPARDQFESQWRPLTFATEAEALADMAAKRGGPTAPPSGLEARQHTAAEEMAARSEAAAAAERGARPSEQPLDEMLAYWRDHPTWMRGDEPRIKKYVKEALKLKDVYWNPFDPFQVREASLLLREGITPKFLSEEAASTAEAKQRATPSWRWAADTDLAGIERNWQAHVEMLKSHYDIAVAKSEQQLRAAEHDSLEFQDGLLPQDEAPAPNRRSQLLAALDDVHQGRPTIDPDTGELIVALTREHAERYLENKLLHAGDEVPGTDPPQPRTSYGERPRAEPAGTAGGGPGEPPPPGVGEEVPFAEGPFSGEGVSAETNAGSSEHTVEVARSWRSRFGDAWRKVWNVEGLHSEAALDLQIKFIREELPIVLKAAKDPIVAKLHELRVPEYQWADYLLVDKQLYQRWQNTGAESDRAAFFAHADLYTKGKGPKAPLDPALVQAVERAQREYSESFRNGSDESTRRHLAHVLNRANEALANSAGGEAASLADFYASEAWQVVSSLFRLNAEAAQSEAFGIQFFSQYRSTFARTVNHPLLMYPAAWSYKVASQWFRFLYNNSMLGRELRLGMAPAVALKAIQDRQDELFAIGHPIALADWEQKGEWKNAFFLFSYLMPGDWSNIPFPLGRNIRLAMRGDWDLSHHLIQPWAGTDVGGGIGILGDMRATSDIAEEVWFNITNQRGQNVEDYLNSIPSIAARGGLPRNMGAQTPYTTYPQSNTVSRRDPVPNDWLPDYQPPEAYVPASP